MVDPAPTSGAAAETRPLEPRQGPSASVERPGQRRPRSVGAEALAALDALPAASVIVLAAHPDDETIGAGGFLHRLRGGLVLHLTDGAPREARFRPADLDREAYARLRVRELTCALAAGGVPPGRAVSLGAADQEAVMALAELARAATAILSHARPAVVITHPYEGGHPDHDAAALVARAAVALLRRQGRPAPRLVEMTSYHADGERLVTGAFFGGRQPHEVARRLSPAEQAAKRAMLDCFESQRPVLAPFAADVSVERFRAAPAADFGAPPHAGPLWYERLGFPISGQRWRAIARRELGALGLPEVLP